MCVCVPGGVVLLALALLGQAFYYIPLASLAAIIIAAVIPVVDLCIVWRIAKLKGGDPRGIKEPPPHPTHVLYTLYRHLDVKEML